MIALLAAIALGQSATPVKGDAPVLGPTLSAGSNSAFQRAVINTEARLEAGDFKGAERLFRVLPTRNFTVAWDDSSVPANVRPSYIEARDKAMKSWSQRFSNGAITVVSHKKGQQPAPQVLITFVESIPPRAEDPLSPAAAHFFSEDPAEPRLEYVISLKRGNPSVLTDFIDVHNEVAFALAQYYGIERSLAFGTYSARTDVPAASLVAPSGYDLSQAKENIQLVDKIAKAIEKRQRLIPTRPKIEIDPPALDGGQATQGDLVKFNIQITNNGNAPLAVRALPDCSCVSVMRAGELGPGETKLFPAMVDLTEVVGELDKSILVYSNDFERNVIRLPVRVKSKALFRLLPENDGFLLAQKTPATQKVYLVLPQGTQMTPLGATFNGLDADVSFEPWSGNLADPDLNEGALPRKGYVFEVTIKDQVPPGRNLGSLFITTDHPKYKQIQSNIYIQSGIVALPERIYYGEIPAAPRRSTFLLSRPGKGFKIQSILVDSPFFTVTQQPNRGDWEYKMTVQFNGKAATGPVLSMITVKTDDASQPVIKIPVQAEIR